DRMLLDMAARYEAARPWHARHGQLWKQLGRCLAAVSRAPGGLAQASPSNHLTWTVSPAVTWPRSCSSTTRALASLMLRRMPDPWVPVRCTCRVPSAAAETIPRWYSVRPAFLRIAPEDTARSMGSGDGSAPLMARRALRTSA